MKKYLIALLTGLVTAASCQAALVLNEPFTYADGSLIVNSGYIWTNHSGTVGQMQVTSGKAVLLGTQTEDVNARLSGAPIATGSLYASFTLNFSTLPGTSPAYFAHFKDDATGASSFFRGRLFSTVTGAAAGSFRLGVASAGATPVVIPKDLALAADHVVVLRYNIATGGTTAWIAPNSEDALSDRADSTDTGTVGPLTAFALRQASGIGTFTLDDLKVGTTFADVVSGSNPTLNPPVISAIPDQSIPRNGTTPPVTFVVRDGETAPGLLAVAATASSNPTLLPTANINITSDGTTNRTLTATPVAGQQGFSQVTVTVTDGDANTATRTFLVIVGAPTLAPIANADTVTNTPTSVSLLVGDAESDALTFDAISTNSVLIPAEALLFSGSGSNRTLSITPLTDLAGVSRITVLVSDGHNTVSNSFLVTVAPKIGLVFSDEFNYPDGPLVSGSGFVWNTHSGSNDQMRVVSGRIFVTSTNSEDVSAFLGVNSFPPGGGWVLYSSFTADFKRLPGGTDYFAHFKNASISFGARIYATTNGAAPGKLRLGIANAGGTPSVIFPVDLDTNVTHTVVCRYNVGTGQSRLWVNPASEASASVTATDGASPFEVFTYSFRESTGIGDIYIDSLKVGTSFADVLAVRPSLVITKSGSAMTLTWPASAAGYVLRFTQAFPPLWADYADQGTVVGDNKVVTIPNPTGTRFFQLRQP